MSRSDSAVGLPDLLVPHGHFGAVVTTALLAQGARAAARFLPDLIKKAKETEESSRLQLLKLEKTLGKAKSKGVRDQLRRRVERQRERYQLLRVKRLLAERGVTGEGPVIEFRRNFLFQKHATMSEGQEKAALRKVIDNYDAKLATLKAEQDLLQKSGYGSDNRAAFPFPLGKGAPFKPPRMAGREIY